MSLPTFQRSVLPPSSGRYNPKDSRRHTSAAAIMGTVPLTLKPRNKATQTHEEAPSSMIFKPRSLKAVSRFRSRLGARRYSNVCRYCCDGLRGTGPFVPPPPPPQCYMSSGEVILTGENRRSGRKTCPSVSFSSTNSTCTALDAKPVPREQQQTPRRLTARSRVGFIQ
jgi:hypothetical protein